MTGPTRRALEKRVAKFRGDDTENVEIIVRDEVIATPSTYRQLDTG